MNVFDRARLAGLPPIWLLVGVSAMGPVVINGVLPANSAIMVELETRYSVVQLVLTVYLLASLFGQIILGNLADRFGRRPVMIVSLLVFSIGGFMCALSSSVEALLVGRFVQGFGASVCVFLPRTIVRDIFGRDQSASVIGYLTTAMMIAPLFGPAMGGWATDNLSWRWMYAGLGGIAGLFAFACWLVQNETLNSDASSRKPMGLLRSSSILIRERVFIASAFMLSGGVGVYYSFLAGAPYVAMESRGYSASMYGIWFAMVAVGYLTGNLIAGRFSERLGVHGMIKLGLIPLSFGITLFWTLSFLTHPVSLFGPMMFIALSNGISLPSLMSVAMSVRPDLISSASGLAGGLQLAYGVVITLILGAVLPLSDYWLFGIMTLSFLICLFGFWLLSGVSN